MIRRLSMLVPVLLLAACGGGSETPGNLAEGAAEGGTDERSYAGDNLTSIDAAANDAAIQPLAPDQPAGAATANGAAAQ